MNAETAWGGGCEGCVCVCTRVWSQRVYLAARGHQDCGRCSQVRIQKDDGFNEGPRGALALLSQWEVGHA